MLYINYHHAFLEDPRWQRHESPHYIFHYFSGSLAERDLSHIRETQEAGYERILAFLRLPAPSQKITYYFYPDAETKTKLMGDDWYAQAIYTEFRVHALYTEDIQPLGPHEDTHLLSLPWGLAVGFFQEGLAEYLVGKAWDGKSHREYVARGYTKNIYPPLESFMRHEQWLETPDEQAIYFYSLAGALTTFLIETYGRDTYERLYRGLDRKASAQKNIDHFEKVFGQTFIAIEREFRERIEKL